MGGPEAGAANFAAHSKNCVRSLIRAAPASRCQTLSPQRSFGPPREQTAFADADRPPASARVTCQLHLRGVAAGAWCPSQQSMLTGLGVCVLAEGDRRRRRRRGGAPWSRCREEGLTNRPLANRCS